MAKPELGEKRLCPNCAAKYYDLNKDPILCPKCGTPFEVAVVHTKTKPEKEVPKPAAAAAAKDDDDDDKEIAKDAIDKEGWFDNKGDPGLDEDETSDEDEDE